MRFLRIVSSLTALCLMTGFFCPETGHGFQALTLYTEQYPPFNYEENGKLMGFAVDIMELMLQQVGSKQTRADMTLAPWARGYMAVTSRPSTVLFAMARTPSRLGEFKWVGPIESSVVSLMAKKDTASPITAVSDLNRMGINVAVLNSDAGEKVLLEAGIDERLLYRAPTSISLINLLYHDRYPLICYGEITARWLWKERGFDPADLESVYRFDSIPVYYAFNPDTPSPVVDRLQKALDDLKAQGTYFRIIDSYIR